MSVSGAMLAGEFYGGAGNDSVLLGGSLGGVIELADGEDSVIATAATAATVLVELENDTFSFTGPCANPAWWVDSVLTASQQRACCVVRRFSAVIRLMAAAPSMAPITSVLLLLPPRLFMATVKMIRFSSAVVQQPPRSTARTMTW